MYYDKDGNEIDTNTIMVTPVVDGQSSDPISVKDLLAGHQKYSAADVRLQQASEAKSEAERIQQENEHRLKIANDLMQAKTGDRDAILRLAQHMEWDETYVRQYMAAADEIRSGGGDPNAAGGNPAPAPTLPAGVTQEDFMDAVAMAKAIRQRGLDPQAVMSQTAKDVVNQGENKIRTELSELIRQNPDLAPIAKNKTKLEKLVTLAEDKLKGRVMSGEKLSPSVQAQSVLDAAEVAKALDIKADVEPPPPGVGPGPVHADDLSGRIPEKPKERPPVTAGVEYENHVTNKLVEVAARLDREAAGAAEV